MCVQSIIWLFGFCVGVLGVTNAFFKYVHASLRAEVIDAGVLFHPAKDGPRFIGRVQIQKSVGFRVFQVCALWCMPLALRRPQQKAILDL